MKSSKDLKISKSQVSSFLDNRQTKTTRRTSELHVYDVFAVCSESRRRGLGAGAVQAASTGRGAGACGRDAAAAAGAGTVQCLRGDDPPPGAGEGAPASAPRVQHTRHAFPWCTPHPGHPGPDTGLAQHPAESGRHVWRHQLPIQPPSCKHRPAKLRPVAQTGVHAQPREQ